MNAPNLSLKGLDLRAELDRLRKERNAVILAHYYQTPDIQDIADFVGDSLDLSRKAQATDAEVIAFCGVRFMAETAKILSPEKIVVLPDMNAGCSLEDSCPPAQFKAFREAHPDHIALTYINSSAEVKALSRHHRHLLVGGDDPRADPARAEDHLRPRQASRRLSRPQDRPRHAALAGRLHRPRGLLRDRADQAQGAASRRAGARPSRMPAAHPRPCRLCRRHVGHPQICARIAVGDDHRRHRAAHHPPDGESGAGTRPSSAPPAPTATATATSAPIWRSTRWRSSTSRCAISSRGSRSRRASAARQEVARPDAGDGRRDGRQGRRRPAANRRRLVPSHRVGARAALNRRCRRRHERGRDRRPPCDNGRRRSVRSAPRWQGRSRPPRVAGTSRDRSRSSSFPC